MMQILKKKRHDIIKAYHSLRTRKNLKKFRPSKLSVQKCKWRNNADSPVMLMVDDLTNAWFDKNGNGLLDTGEDWGAGKYGDNSVMNFIETQLLEGYPEVKITFFLIVGRMASFTSENNFTYAAPVNADNEAAAFFRRVYKDERYELAYHGLTHGIAASTGFTQEWKTFPDLGTAVDVNKKGIEVYRNTFGEPPEGGKYGGYKRNQFGDKSIDLCAFKWWCRDWYGEECYSEQNAHLFDLCYFGKNKVVDIPSNIHGFWWTKKQIRTLLQRRQIISIQEHIAPFRTDGKIQVPNIVNDFQQLRSLFKYLGDKNVWYSTCSDVANYFIAYTESRIYDVHDDYFRVEYTGPAGLEISLIIDARSKGISRLKIILPDSAEYSCKTYISKPGLYLATVPVMNGKYLIKISTDNTKE